MKKEGVLTADPLGLKKIIKEIIKGRTGDKQPGLLFFKQASSSKFSVQRFKVIPAGRLVSVQAFKLSLR